MKGYWKSLLEKYNNLMEEGPSQIIIHNPQNITINNAPSEGVPNISPEQNNVSQQPYNDEEQSIPDQVNSSQSDWQATNSPVDPSQYGMGLQDPSTNMTPYQDEPTDQPQQAVDPNSVQFATPDTLNQFQAPDGTPFANPDGSPLDFEKQKYEDEDYPNEDDLPSAEKPDGNAPVNPDNQVQNTLPYQDEEPQTTESVTSNEVPQQNINPVQPPALIQQAPQMAQQAPSQVQPQVDPNLPQPYNDEPVQDPNQQVQPLPGDQGFNQQMPVDPQQMQPQMGAPPVDPQAAPPMDMGMQAGANFDPTQIQQQNSGIPGQIKDPIAPDYYDDEEGMVPDPNNPGEMMPSEDVLPQSNSQTPIPRDGIRKMNELKDIHTNLIEIKKILKNETHPMMDKLRKKHTESLEYFESMIENLDSFSDIVDDMIIKYKRFLLLLLVELATFKKKIAEIDEEIRH